MTSETATDMLRRVRVRRLVQAKLAELSSRRSYLWREYQRLDAVCETLAMAAERLEHPQREE